MILVKIEFEERTEKYLETFISKASLYGLIYLIEKLFFFFFTSLNFTSKSKVDFGLVKPNMSMFVEFPPTSLMFIFLISYSFMVFKISLKLRCES